MQLNWEISLISADVDTSTPSDFGPRRKKYKYFCSFKMFYVIAIYCLKKNYPPLSDSDSNGDIGTYFEVPKLSEVLDVINMYKNYMGAKS